VALQRTLRPLEPVDEEGVKPVQNRDQRLERMLKALDSDKRLTDVDRVRLGEMLISAYQQKGTQRFSRALDRAVKAWDRLVLTPNTAVQINLGGLSDDARLVELGRRCGMLADQGGAAKQIETKKPEESGDADG